MGQIALPLTVRRASDPARIVVGNANRSAIDALSDPSGWPFRTALRFNVYDSASLGVTAYNDTLYLLAYHDLPVLSDSSPSDAAVLEDGSDIDWED